jgi:malate/lactate dehydrogenase
MQGTVMELDDCAYPLLAEIKTTTDLKEGFTGCQVAILVGAKPRGPGMERKDLLSQNG